MKKVENLEGLFESVRGDETLRDKSFALVKHIQESDNCNTIVDVVNVILANSKDEEEAIKLTLYVAHLLCDSSSLLLLSILSYAGEKPIIEIKSASPDQPLGFITEEEIEPLKTWMQDMLHEASGDRAGATTMEILDVAMSKEDTSVKSFLTLIIGLAMDNIEEE